MTVWHFGAQSDLASERLVLETAHFVVSAPFACRERWRLYLAPKRHSPDARPATMMLMAVFPSLCCVSTLCEVIDVGLLGLPVFPCSGLWCDNGQCSGLFPNFRDGTGGFGPCPQESPPNVSWLTISLTL